MKVDVLQLDFNNEFAKKIAFMPYKFVLEQYGCVDKNLYNLVWSGELDVNGLEDIFEIFNINHPKDFKGHSLSVSDIVIFNGENYYCDSFGWVKF